MLREGDDAEPADLRRLRAPRSRCASLHEASQLLEFSSSLFPNYRCAVQSRLIYSSLEVAQDEILRVELDIHLVPAFWLSSAGRTNGRLWPTVASHGTDALLRPSRRSGRQATTPSVRDRISGAARQVATAS